MRIRHKLKGNKGFSLAETLLAVLILLLVSVIVAGGIPAAKNVYNKVIVGANAQVLLSTTVTALRNELGLAKDVTVSGTNITYFKSSISNYANLSIADNGIMVTDYYDRVTEGPIAGSTPRNLVSDAAANKNLIVTYESAVADNEAHTVTIQNIRVNRKGQNDTFIASLNELVIRTSPVSD